MRLAIYHHRICQEPLAMLIVFVALFGSFENILGTVYEWM